jgi:hypothetical protein
MFCEKESYKSTAESTTRVAHVTVEVIPEDTEQVTARKSASDEVVHPVAQIVQDVAHHKMSPKNLIPEIISVDVRLCFYCFLLNHYHTCNSFKYSNIFFIRM